MSRATPAPGGSVAEPLRMPARSQGRSMRRAREIGVAEDVEADLALSPFFLGARRAQAMSPNGELVQDFHLVRRLRALHILNAPSPASTASLAIGEEIAVQIERDLSQ